MTDEELAAWRAEFERLRERYGQQWEPGSFDPIEEYEAAVKDLDAHVDALLAEVRRLRALPGSPPAGA